MGSSINFKTITMNSKWILLLVLVNTSTISAYSQCTLPPVLYVDSAALGASTGLSWIDAFTDLQDAINVNDSCGGGYEVWVAKGTYFPSKENDPRGIIPGLEDRSFVLKKPIKVIGGFSSGDTSITARNLELNRTILEAALPSLDTVYNILEMQSDSVGNNWLIDGVLFRNARARGPLFYDIGGAIRIYYAYLLSPIIRNCVFENNYADKYGGAIGFVTDGFRNSKSYPVIESCKFYNNDARWGGAISLLIWADLPFPFTLTPSPTANSVPLEIYSEASPVIEQCIFKECSAYRGGAVYLHTNSFNGAGQLATGIVNHRISNCLFYDNSSETKGGAIYCNSVAAGGDPEPYANLEEVAGEIVNSAFYNNTAGEKGGALYFQDTSYADRTTISTNPRIANTIFWNNNATEGNNIFMTNYFTGESVITHSIFTSGSIHGDFGQYIDTIQRDPMFVDVNVKDFRLKLNSPAINSGSNMEVHGVEDLIGKPRILEDTVDIGAFETGDICSSNLVFVRGSRFMGPSTYSFNTSGSIYCSSIVNSNASLIFNTGQEVQFDSFFQIEYGGSMQIYNEGCPK